MLRVAGTHAAAADLALFQRWARTRSPVADLVLPRLSHAANRSVLWFATAAVIASAGGERGRRAALRGAVSIAVTSACVNGPVKAVFRRTRPPIAGIPLARRLARQPASASFPSGHAASAAAFATAVGCEWPALALGLAPAALAVAWSRVHTGVHYPGDCAVGMLAGATVATVVRRVWPVPEVGPAQHLVPVEAPAISDGSGVTLVVNAAAGSGCTAADLRALLPRAAIREVWPGDDLPQVIADAAGDCRVLAVAGGDGTLNAAAAAAVAVGVPLLALPCGTMNHFARHLGIETVDDAVRALAAGSATRVRVATANGQPFLNTSTLSESYSRMVELRGRLQRYVGRWPAMVAALAWTLATDQPFTARIDGRPHRLWLLFVGNGHYAPGGLAPTWRPGLHRPELDVRIVLADRPLARARVLAGAVTRRLRHSPVYVERSVAALTVTDADRPLPVARDGETGPSVREVRFAHLSEPLVAYCFTLSLPSGH